MISSTRKVPRKGREPQWLPVIIHEEGPPEVLVGFQFDKRQDALDEAGAEIRKRQENKSGPR